MVTQMPAMPIAISVVGGKYLLFDIEAISWLRNNHNTCGVFVGTLPQNPSQNVFMGLPMQIMVEEAQLLIELGLAYILDDAKAHDFANAKVDKNKCNNYLAEIETKTSEISDAKAKEKEATKKKAMKKVREKMAKNTPENLESNYELPDVAQSLGVEAESLFSPESEVVGGPNSSQTFVSNDGAAKSQHQSNSGANWQQLRLTPTTSSLLNETTTDEVSTSTILPDLSASSYALYKHLHQSRTFFHTPGLRFGSQYSVYPGDPLRFHSHFLAVGLDWEQEIDLMDIVGGGRLGTGVKKGFLLGAKASGRETRIDGGNDSRMRCFSIEWAGM